MDSQPSESASARSSRRGKAVNINLPDHGMVSNADSLSDVVDGMSDLLHPGLRFLLLYLRIARACHLRIARRHVYYRWAEYKARTLHLSCAQASRTRRARIRSRSRSTMD